MSEHDNMLKFKLFNLFQKDVSKTIFFRLLTRRREWIHLWNVQCLHNKIIMFYKVFRYLWTKTVNISFFYNLAKTEKKTLKIHYTTFFVFKYIRFYPLVSEFVWPGGRGEQGFKRPCTRQVETINKNVINMMDDTTVYNISWKIPNKYKN